MGKLTRLLGGCLLLIIQLTATAQNIPSSFTKITTFEGLPSNTVGAVLKDSVGFIWIGTKLGLCRFDGREIKKYDELGEANIWSFEELNRDILLIGTISDLRVYNRKTREVDTLDIVPIIVKALKKTDDSSFFAGTQSGLYHINNGEIQRVIFDTGLSSSNHITSIIKEDENTYWFSTADGLGKIDLRTFRTSIFKMENAPLNSNYFICLAQVGGYIYLGSFNKGVFRFHMESQQFEIVQGFQNDMVMTMRYADNHLYVGTNGKGLKVLSLTDQKLSVISHKEKNNHSIGSNTITSFLYDNGILWIGTQFRGLNYNLPRNRKFSYYENKTFFSSDYNVRSFYTLDNGDKLIGTRTGLFYVSERKGLTKSYSIEDPSSHLRSNIIVFIKKINNKVLICTYGGGIYVFNEQTLTLEDFSREEELIYGCFFHCTEDKNGDVWFASTEGVYHSSIDGRIIHRYDVANSGLNNNTILFLYRDSLERLWIGTHFGLFLMDMSTGEIRSSDFLKQPITSLIQYVIEDSKKNIWICSNNGLYHISPDLALLNHYTHNDLLPDNIIMSIVEDPTGILWFTTLKEIVRYEPLTGASYVFQKMDGLEGFDFNNNVFLDKDGTIWWANEGGLIYKSDHEDYIIPERLSKPIVTSYSIFNKEYDPVYMDYPVKVSLPSAPNNIRFRLSNMDYYPPYANLYEYMLEGYDSDWKQQEGVDEVTYSDLPSGKYTFKLRNPDGSSQEQEFIISVRYSYYTFFWIGIIILLVVCFIFYYTKKIEMLKKRMRDERAILSTVQQQAKTKTTLLRPQETSTNNEMMERLLEYMDKEKLYLNPKLSINDVSAKLDCTATELSFFLNKHMQVNFSYFVNTYRVNEIKQRLNENNLSKYTLKTLSEQCGFNSQTTFYRVFKTVVGMTPVEYCKKMNLIIDEK